MFAVLSLKRRLSSLTQLPERGHNNAFAAQLLLNTAGSLT